MTNAYEKSADGHRADPRIRRSVLVKIFAAYGALTTILVMMLGTFTGIGAYTFGYGNGLSYLSADPVACTNCHVMQNYFDSWQKSSHHHAAVCIDCHLPHDFVGKYVSKADNGFFHSLAFTLNNFHEPIQIKPRNQRILQNNCVACHVETIHNMLPESQNGEIQRCTHCHADVGHGR